MSACTALVVYRGPARVCGRPFHTYDSAGQPRCGLHSQQRGSRSRKPESGEFQVEPDLVTCSLSCSTCGERSEIVLPGDEPAREVLAALSCPKCFRRGALAFCSNRERTAPS